MLFTKLDEQINCTMLKSHPGRMSSEPLVVVLPLAPLYLRLTSSIRQVARAAPDLAMAFVLGVIWIVYVALDS